MTYELNDPVILLKDGKEIPGRIVGRTLATIRGGHGFDVQPEGTKHLQERARNVPAGELRAA